IDLTLAYVMAFNPMRGFRKHQKAWFAGLTIVCMVTFVMCSGVGAGSSILESLGLTFGFRHRADIVATLYGKDVGAREIQDIRMQRRLANQYMEFLTASSRDQVAKSVMEASNKWPEADKRKLQEVLFYRSISLQSPQFRQGYLQKL